MIDPVCIRAAQRSDAPAIASIYNEGIRGRQATFETREREPREILEWIEHPRYPVLVAELEGEILGWIAASSYRPRECYSGIVEFSVYVRGSAQSRGLGDQLLAPFLEECRQAGFWKVLSRIFPENVRSLRLCARHGFREVGTYRRHGRLDGVWRDVVIVERLLDRQT